MILFPFKMLAYIQNVCKKSPGTRRGSEKKDEMVDSYHPVRDLIAFAWCSFYGRGFGIVLCMMVVRVSGRLAGEEGVEVVISCFCQICGVEE